MELTSALIAAPWQTLALAGFAVALLATCRGAAWRWLLASGAGPRLAAAATAVLVVWQVRAAPDGGPAFHLLGATLLTLAFGWRFAVIALGGVLAVSAAAGGSGFWALGANGIANVLVPVAASYGWARATERWLPANLFVYVFSSAFFGAALAMTAAVLASALMLAASGAAPPGELAANYLPTSLLLLFPEAFLTGGLVTLAVVYRPTWLVSFDDRDWLGER